MRYILFGFSLMISLQSFGQKKYFQQSVDYKIDVKLDDESHILRGFETIKYYNNSPDTLRYLFFHLYPNAYKNDHSAFTEQQVQNGQTDFYYSKENDRGFIDSLNFQVDGNGANLSQYNNMEDVVLLELPTALLPNKSVDISTTFRVVIPEVFSRLGHEKQNYQISQWYPKPAVYDNKGWHPMPYLDQGEFYSEFGNYEVNITIPDNYVVAATGVLQTASEKQFIQQRIEKLDSSKVLKEIPSSATWKTIQFKQDNVHDFAWFADKRFQIERSILALKSGEKISCYSYFKPENYSTYKNSSKVIYHTVNYLSNHVGKYPYAHASIVDGALLAGGGMEYPMITVIGKVNSRSMLQTVIVHEVGHNWFQGILASNERENPWMDEGINSFYEAIIDDEITMLDSTKTNLKGRNAMNTLNGIMVYLLSAKENEDQAIATPSVDFTNLNYGGIVYKKTQLMLNYLQSYLGETTFEHCMKTYFNEWNLKHPSPEDFRKIIERESGKNLDWFFNDGLTSTKKIDFKIKSIKKVGDKKLVYVKNKTNFQGPIPVQVTNNGNVKATKWIEFPYKEPATFNAEELQNVQTVEIDAEHKLPEINITNNRYKLNSLLPKNNLKLKAFTSFGQRKNNEIYVLPALGYNHYNGFMVGAAIHNLKLPNNKFQFAFSPMYSAKANALVGSGVIGYSMFPEKTFQRITISVAGRSYHHNSSDLNVNNALYTRHLKLAPTIDFDFKQKFARSTAKNNISFRYVYIANQSFGYERSVSDSLFRPYIQDYSKSHFGHMLFTHKNTRTLNPFSYAAEMTGNQNFLKIGLTSNARIDYHLKNKSLYVRAFAGKFFDFKTNTNTFALRNQYLNTTYTAQNDFIYDDIYLGRNEQEKFVSQQVSMREGGFKVSTLRYANPIGISNDWLLALNLRSDIPIKMPVKVQAFLDFGSFANAKNINPSQQKALYDAGLELHLFKEAVVIYAPLLLSKDFKEYTKQIYPKNRLINTMSFSLQLHQLNFIKTAQLTSKLMN